MKPPAEEILRIRPAEILFSRKYFTAWICTCVNWSFGYTVSDTHLATDARGAPEVDFELVSRVFVAGAFDDAVQAVPGIVDDDVNTAKVLVDVLKERLGPVCRVSDVVFDNEEFVGGVSRRERGDT